MNGSEPIGALAQWRAELRAGLYRQRIDRPSTWRFDALHTAACYEAAGFDALRDGLSDAAADHFRRAAEVIADAIAKRAT